MRSQNRNMASLVLISEARGAGRHLGIFDGRFSGTRFAQHATMDSPHELEEHADLLGLPLSFGQASKRDRAAHSADVGLSKRQRQRRRKRQRRLERGASNSTEAGVSAGHPRGNADNRRPNPWHVAGTAASDSDACFVSDPRAAWRNQRVVDGWNKGDPHPPMWYSQSEGKAIDLHARLAPYLVADDIAAGDTAETAVSRRCRVLSGVRAAGLVCCAGAPGRE